MQVVRAVAKLQCAAPFRQPVPRDVPGYHQEIANPMDLGTVASKLRARSYASLAEAQRDINRVRSGPRAMVCARESARIAAVRPTVLGYPEPRR
jgi:Bromodomain